MKRILTICLVFFAALGAQATVHNVDVSGLSFTPQNLIVETGDTVVWTNTGGFHNVNGSTSTYPGNPVSFSNGPLSSSPWSYTFVFTVAGLYDYQCDAHVSAGMSGTVTVEDPAVCDTGTPPSGLSTFLTATEAQLSWHAIINSVGCEVKATRTSPPGPTGTKRTLGFEVITTNIPFTILGPGTTWDWKVRCACTVPPDPITATGFSLTQQIDVPLLREGQEQGQTMTVFPNQGQSSVVTLQFEEGLDANANYVIYNISGQMVSSGSLSGYDGAHTAQIDVDQLEQGVYFVEVRSETGMQSSRFVRN